MINCNQILMCMTYSLYLHFLKKIKIYKSFVLWSSPIEVCEVVRFFCAQTKEPWRISTIDMDTSWFSSQWELKVFYTVFLFSILSSKQPGEVRMKMCDWPQVIQPTSMKECGFKPRSPVSQSDTLTTVQHWLSLSLWSEKENNTTTRELCDIFLFRKTEWRFPAAVNLFFFLCLSPRQHRQK